MKITSRLLLLGFSLCSLPLFAGTAVESNTADTSTGQSTRAFPFEFDAEYSYIGESDVTRGSRDARNFDENYSLLRFIYTPRIKFGILRLGASWERFDFGGTSNVQIPDALQSVTAIVGLDTQFSDSILVRFEAQPGLYGSEDLEGDTFHLPFVFGGTYIYNPNLQFVFGVSVDYERDYPVFPGGGVRWRFAPQWVLNAVVPTPRLEFEASKNLTLYAGANLKGSTFRVEEGFANGTANGRLNRAVVSYTEVRTGLGLEWKISPDLKISVEGGYLPYRQFDFHRADVRYHQDGGAPYGGIALRAAF